MQTAGFVLVGGHSLRMGRDKALLRWNSRPLVEDLAVRAAAVAGSVALIGEPERYRDLGFDCFPDLRAGFGPLAGIEAALESGRGDLNLVLACDMPGLKREWLSRLLSAARKSNSLCLACRESSGIVHPLCAVYRRDCLPAVRNALDCGRLKLLDLMRELDAAIFEIGHTISNVNTPRDWAAWQHGGKAARAADGN